MSSSMWEQMEAELRRLDTTMRELVEAGADLESATEEATARNRLVTATVDATGVLTGLVFHTDAYRGMAAAELSATLVEVIDRAQRRMADRVARAYDVFAPEGVDTAAVLRGEMDVDEALRAQGFSPHDFD
ncbi:YbaB/EbfC family nucleoid-associated protein [Nocardiopsis sp. N85]|uniref:YbaB/EbfC family nucleoid-associated protein n=1 Tax=Nocardiopsis sp. N85 TaxID=3029400 RepID=UPI00237FBB9F|nr:YbaB/EbfC family nucleoid-associated protein [Nocardiopsis sp. N85]MDE3721918.1 YbaB/EbfC family nucleoid-associated protein [Nocardiopsis sp. N85]